MTNITLNLGSEYVTFNYGGGQLQLQSNTGRDFKPISIEELDIMITWFEGVRQDMGRRRRNDDHRRM